MNRILTSAVCLGVLILFVAEIASAQTTDAAQAIATPAAPAADASVPRLVQFSGLLPAHEARSGAVSVTFAIYAEQDGGAALWSETQNILADQAGHYSALLGTATAGGFPADLIGTGQSRWLGVTIARLTESPRVLLASVPYALKAGDADTLGGLPAAAYVTTQQLAARTPTPFVNGGGTTVVATSGVATAAAPAGTARANAAQVTDATPTGSGTTDFIPLWTSGSNLGNSILFQTGGKLGLGTTTPASTLDINGGQILRGGFYEYPQNTATASAGQPSHSFQWLASVFDSTTKAAVNEAFGFRAVPDQNNVASPTAKLDLFYGTGGPTGSTSDLGLSINHSGVITFVSGQTFPGVAEVGTSNSFDSSQTFADGITSFNPSIGITGLATATTSGGVGIEGVGTSPTSAGVVGNSPNIGVYGTSQGASTTGSGRGKAGVWGDTGGTAGGGYVAVVGTADNNSAGDFVNNGIYSALIAKNKGNGVGMQAQSASGIAIYGEATSPSVSGATYEEISGVWGDSNQSGAAGILGTVDFGSGGVFVNNSSRFPSAMLINTASALASPLLEAQNPTTGDGCNILSSGALVCTTAEIVTATVDQTRQVAQYSIQSPENWSEDFGSATLVNGVASVPLEATFAQTVNTGVGYHVYLTPNGDCKGLYVANKTANGFEVREIGGGSSSVAFDYRIVAKRVGRENVRLEDMTAQQAQIRNQLQQMRAAAPKLRPAAAPEFMPSSAPRSLASQPSAGTPRMSNTARQMAASPSTPAPTTTPTHH